MHDALTAAARRQGQSLQQYVLAVLEREARFAANRELLAIDPIGDGLPLPAIVTEITRVVTAWRHRDRGVGGDRPS